MRRQDCEVTCPQEKGKNGKQRAADSSPWTEVKNLQPCSSRPHPMVHWFTQTLHQIANAQSYKGMYNSADDCCFFLSQTDNLYNQGRTYDFEALVRNTKRGHILRKYQQPKFGVLQYIQHIFYSNYNTHVFFNSTNYNWYKC